jgi:hypothetical protein
MSDPDEFFARNRERAEAAAMLASRQNATPERTPEVVRLMAPQRMATPWQVTKPRVVVGRVTTPTPSPSPVMAPTPIPVTPIRVVPITHLYVESSRWSNPLYVPAGKSVGIKFSIGRMRIERDGMIVQGILYRNVPAISYQNGFVLRPLESLDHTPRVVWFQKGIRQLRFISLERNQAEDVEVLWKSE